MVCLPGWCKHCLGNADYMYLHDVFLMHTSNLEMKAQNDNYWGVVIGQRDCLILPHSRCLLHPTL